MLPPLKRKSWSAESTAQSRGDRVQTGRKATARVPPSRGEDRALKCPRINAVAPKDEDDGRAARLLPPLKKATQFASSTARECSPCTPKRRGHVRAKSPHQVSAQKAPRHERGHPSGEVFLSAIDFCPSFELNMWNKLCPFPI